MAYETMYPGINNSPLTELAASISASDTTITVDSAAVLPAAPNILTIGNDENAELVRYGGISGNQVTDCERGFNDTTAQIWPSGTIVFRGYTEYDHAAFAANITELAAVKLNKDGDAKDATVTFTQAGSKVNIATGEKFSVILGKVAKWFSSFGAAAWMGVGAESSKVAAGIHATQHGSTGDDPVTPAAIGAAPSTHASRHASGGADAITPAAIGAAAAAHAHGSITNAGKIGTTADLPVFTLSGGTLGTKSKADARIALDLDPRGFEYGGREIPFTWAQIKAKIAAGDFTGLRVGDYKDITLNGTFYDAAAGANKTITNNVFRMEIAGIDSYYRYADTNVPHHIDFISRDCLAGNLLYNVTATNSGAYIGSALFTTLNGANGLQSLLPSDVAAVILNKRGLTEVKTSASASSWAWNDMGKLWLPTEQEVWGHVTWAEHGYGGGLSVHYPIFQDGLRHIVKGDGNGGSRCTWWCASSVAGSAAYFCYVTSTGYPYYASATAATVRVPLCFRVA